ncbi:ATP-binding protein [Streptomyces cyaneofuscatus]|uniref:ATP-binding protein n=1 Tax=Streptomyces cyaneofuscatus TaxID=66883 RepID=UPI0033DF5322
MTGNEADTAGHVCRPASAAEARREVEFALHPLLCSADSYYLRAHRAGFEDAVLVASELVGHVLHHPEDSPGCFLVCLLHRDEVTITVTDTCEEILPLCPRAPAPGGTGLAGVGWWVINKVADQVVVQTLPTGGKTITVAVPLSGP